jgi:hypothetical protein
MGRYRKIPIVIEAVKLAWDTWNEVCDFVSKEAFVEGVYLNDKGEIIEHKVSAKLGLLINTLSGEVLVSEGDYILKGVKGEFYPCKADIFYETYEKVSGSE